jgi:RNA-directed DNA polymerase
MARVAARVTDKRVLKLIRAFLKSGVMEGGLVSPVDEGTPQGGPLSPLLSNLVLDDLDTELARRGHRFCRYADDCNIYVRSRRAGDRVMASVSRFLTQKLRLTVNEAKSAGSATGGAQVPGLQHLEYGSERRIAPKALDKFKTQVRNKTRRTRGISLQQLIETSRHTSSDGAATSASARPHACSRTSKRGFRRTATHRIFGGNGKNGPTASRDLRRRGVPKVHAAVAAGSPTGILAHVRTPAVQQALRNQYFDSLGLPPTPCAAKLNSVEPPWYGPVCPVVWEGRTREASPYPDQYLRVQIGPAARMLATWLDSGADLKRD